MNIVSEKIARLANGGVPRVLDLFSGCGGISLGFHRAGAEIVGGVEFNEHAAQAHAVNFHRKATEEERAVFGRSRDIRKTDPHELVREFGHTDPIRAVDFIVGGPPCQAYARVGRAKLREVLEHPQAFKVDERGSLFEHYLRFVGALRPVALLMENVPDILSYGGDNVAEVIADGLEDLGYTARYTLLNAAAYGVPQTRERFYLLAWDSEVSREPPTFPRPRHNLDALPIGYRGTRAAARRLEEQQQLGFLPGSNPPNRYDSCEYFDWNGLPEPVSVQEALQDLPAITGHLTGEIGRGARRFDTTIPYDQAPTHPYARLMREGWPGFENDEGIRDHVIRWLPRDYDIFREMSPGDQYPEAHTKALQMRDRAVRARERELGRPLDGDELAEMTRRIVPPYDPGKFPNKWRKMESDAPARTLMAHLGKDSYSHIHYDSEQARTISVREAARLQSFPDGFVFCGTMNPAFKMIGNAVPPLMAYEIADHLIAQLNRAIGRPLREAIGG